MTKPEPSRRRALYALTVKGAKLARLAAAGLDAETEIFLPERLKEDTGAAINYFGSLRETVAANFGSFSGHIFITAPGIAVRCVAPLLISKKEDPAVVVLTQDGRFAVSLVSGHLGGGNDLAVQVAEICGAQAVIGTATDLEGLPALEVIARDLGLEIENFSKLPTVSSYLVEGGRLKIYDPLECLKQALAAWPGHFEFVEKPPAREEIHVRVDYRQRPDDASGLALVMRPRLVVLGLGCHRGIERSEMDSFIDATLSEEKISPQAVALMTTVESRAQEPAFLDISRDRGWPLVIFTKAELSGVEVPNPSGKVMERIGVSSVCEAAAMLAAKTDSLLISKRKSARATLAAALRK